MIFDAKFNTHGSFCTSKVRFVLTFIGSREHQTGMRKDRNGVTDLDFLAQEHFLLGIMYFICDLCSFHCLEWSS